MITLTAITNGVQFIFEDSKYYLYGNGTINVPINSLSLVLDNSGAATFRKAASNDIFVSAPLSEFGMTAEEIESFYTSTMVGSTTSSGDVTSGDVQTMIDASISGKADSVSAVSSAEYVSSSTTINFKNIDGTVISSIDASDFVIDGMIEDVRIETLSGASYLVIDFNTESGKEDISIPLTDIFDPSNYYNKQEVDNLVSAATDDMATQTWVGEQGYITGVDLSNYAESSAVTQEISAAVSGKSDTTALTAVNDVLTAHTANTDIHVTAADKNAWNAKSDFSGSYNDLTDKPTIPTVPTSNTAFTNDAGYITADALSATVSTSAITTAVTSASTNDEIPSALAVYAATSGGSGGGASYTAGRGIDITNDTISFSLPISSNTNNGISMGGKLSRIGTNNGNDTLMVGSENDIKSGSDCSIAVGYRCTLNGDGAMVVGYNSSASTDFSISLGDHTKAYGMWSFAQGSYVYTTNVYEHSQGKYNVSNTGSTTADRTLFSVGNGTADNARHNAFEIRQNGDIYISSGGTDIKLQDNLGGGTVDPSLNSGSTNAVANSAITNAINEIEEVSAAAFNALNDELSGKQDTLIAGDNITISGNVISASGGGASYTAGNGISIDTANTISFNLPIYSGTGTGALLVGDNGHYDNANYKSVASEEGAIAFPSRYLYGKNVASGQSSFAHGYDCKAGRCAHAEGSRTYASGEGSHAEGFETIAKGMNCHTEGGNTIAGKNGDTVCAHAEGNHTSALTHYSHAEGSYTIAKNTSEHASGQYNNSVSASTAFGNSGNTLFSVGNGTADNARHNAFEIRQNGDIYISSGGTDIKLQDNLGGGDVSSAITSGDTNAVAGGAVFEQLGGLKFVSLTQTEYNNLQNKDANTLYIITSGQTCTPTSTAFTNVDEYFSFSSPVYELKFDFGISDPYGDGSGYEAQAYLTEDGSTRQGGYGVVANYDGYNDEISVSIESGGTDIYTATTQGSSITVDLCQIFGQGMYLDSEVIPNVQTCASEECTEYDCLQWDEETGECIEQGDCMQTECTQYDDNYVMYAKL